MCSFLANGLSLDLERMEKESMGVLRRRFMREFEPGNVRRLLDGVSVAELSRALEVNPNILHRWVRESRWRNDCRSRTSA